MAVLEKGKAPGSHLLSGAVIDPKPLERARARRAVPVVRRGARRVGAVPDARPRACRCPIPPTMRNHGNVIVSLSQLGRWLAEVAEELGVAILPETAAEKLLVADGPGRGRAHGRQGARARGRGARPVRARVGHPGAGDDPGRGDAGASHDAALERFELGGSSPQTWALGVKEVWKVATAAARGDPHDGLAAAVGREVPRVRRLVRLPDGRGHAHDRDGRRARLPRRGALGARPAAGAEDPSADPADPRGRRAGGVGGEDDPGGRVRRAAAAASGRPGC